MGQVFVVSTSQTDSCTSSGRCKSRCKPHLWLHLSTGHGRVRLHHNFVTP